MIKLIADVALLEQGTNAARQIDHLIDLRRQAPTSIGSTETAITASAQTAAADLSKTSKPVTNGSSSPITYDAVTGLYANDPQSSFFGRTATSSKIDPLTGSNEVVFIETQLYVVFLDDAPGNGGLEQRTKALLNSLGREITPTLVYDQLNGFAVKLSSTEAKRLQALGGAKSIEADAAVFLEPPVTGSTWSTSANQNKTINTQILNRYSNISITGGEILPWGVQAVWQGKDISTKGNAFNNTYAFVIDSGLRNTTGDLNLATTSSWHRSWITGETPFADGNGHGTHVSHTIAALVNGTGVVGVAPGANIVSLKVFNSTGSGASYTSIIDAINHAVSVINTNALDKTKVVINMSLGGSFSSSLDTAVKNAASQNIRFSIAAGNNGQDADGYSPAAAGDHANVFTVSAVDSAYRMASFSNWDRVDRRDGVDDVDVAAPGVGVLSYNGSSGALVSWDGTSMAAPHVAGLLLTGGVTRGDLVTPFTSGTADPFAWASSTVI